MRVVIAPDSFKGSLPAAAVCAALEVGVRRARPAAAVTALPLSDGGEGLIEVLARGADARLVPAACEDPLGRPVVAPIALLDGGETIAVEVAQAVGLGLLAPTERDPLRASSHGVGRLLRAALALAPRTLWVGLGGSATVDGGGGMAAALGARFVDAAGAPIPAAEGERFAGRHLARVAGVDPAPALRACAGVRVEALCDVTTPLVDGGGRLGAARLYGPQKGATPAQVEQLAAGLAGYAAALAGSGLPPVAALPGGGAAGGLGAALHAFCGAALVSGFARVAARLGLAAAIAHADLVLTGEGRLDEQTAEGKVVAGVVDLARAAGVPVVALVGQSALPEDAACAALGLAAVVDLTRRVGLAAALADPARLLAEAAADVVALGGPRRGT
jgi:glycerate kinase